jgi:ABC-type sugar transport system ATPase subunit
LQGVSLTLEGGSVLGLIGDNGAGKSTLVKCLSGVLHPDDGEILIDGELVAVPTPREARALGIETVYQDLALVDELPVYLNFFIRKEVTYGWLPIMNQRRMRKLARQYLDEIGISIPTVNAEVAHLSGGQRQAIAVARAVQSEADILLLDEPLAAMGAKEGAIILNLIQELKEQGDVSMIMIAHNYAQIVDVCDRVNLLQHGEITYDKPVSETSVHELTELVASEYRLSGNGGRAAR